MVGLVVRQAHNERENDAHHERIYLPVRPEPVLSLSKERAEVRAAHGDSSTGSELKAVEEACREASRTVEPLKRFERLTGRSFNSVEPLNHGPGIRKPVTNDAEY